MTPKSCVANSGILMLLLELSGMHTSVKDLVLSFWTMSSAMGGRHPWHHALLTGGTMKIADTLKMQELLAVGQVYRTLNFFLCVQCIFNSFIFHLKTHYAYMLQIH